jgi:mRNA interferase RelE/StbE
VSRRVEWAKQALKALSRLDRPTQERILAAIDDLAQLSKGDVRRLEGGTEEAFRLRVGGWRIIFSYPDDTTAIVHRVRPRGDAHKR